MLVAQFLDGVGVDQLIVLDVRFVDEGLNGLTLDDDSGMDEKKSFKMTNKNRKATIRNNFLPDAPLVWSSRPHRSPH